MASRRARSASLVGAALMAIAGSPPARPASLESATLNSGPETRGCVNGYRRQGLVRDFALGRSWLVFASCAHPEMPRLAVAVSRTASLESARPGPVAALFSRSSPAVAAVAVETRARTFAVPPPVLPPEPAIQSGSPVRLWRQSLMARVELTGVALESGAPGSRIRVRISSGGAVLRGTVRGPGSVELEAAGGLGFAETAP